jgi:hypothetical protein
LTEGTTLTSNVVEYHRASETSSAVEVIVFGEEVHFLLQGREGSMTVHLYNALGQEITRLSGENLITWSLPPQAASGVYFYQVVCDGEVHSGRIWLRR